MIELPTKGQITSIHPVAPDVSVITTDSDGFFTYNLRTKTNVHYSFLTCKALPAKPILSAYVDRSSEVWFEQEEPGVVAHFNPSTGVVTREQILIEYSNPERSRPAFHIHEDVNGYLWVHPYGGGFSYFDPQKNGWFLSITDWVAVTGASPIRFIRLSPTNKVIYGFAPTPRDWRR